MEYEMRWKKRQMSGEQTNGLMARARYGILCTVDADGCPYGLPISYAYDAPTRRVFMHCSAAGGHNLDNVVARPKASFTVVEDAELLPEQFSTQYCSAIATGTVRIAEGLEKREGIEAILRKLAPDNIEAGMAYIDRAFDRLAVIVLDVDRMTGKRRPKSA